MPSYKVREGFYLHQGETVHLPGTKIELSEDEANKYLAQIELVPPKSKKEEKQ
jgi:hypothetical protein